MEEKQEELVKPSEGPTVNANFEKNLKGEEIQWHLFTSYRFLETAPQDWLLFIVFMVVIFGYHTRAPGLSQPFEERCQTL